MVLGRDHVGGRETEPAPAFAMASRPQPPYTLAVSQIITRQLLVITKDAVQDFCRKPGQRHIIIGQITAEPARRPRQRPVARGEFVSVATAEP
jgi:hypothetical protein